jgi:hypothetical protein
VELAPVAAPGENPIRNREIVEHQDEIEIHRGALHAAQRHGESTDERVTHARRIELTAHGGDDLGEIHPKDSGQSRWESEPMATARSEMLRPRRPAFATAVVHAAHVGRDAAAIVIWL